MKTFYFLIKSKALRAILIALIAVSFTPQNAFSSHCTGLNDSGEGFISAVCLGNDQYEITVRWGNGSAPNVGSGVKFRLLGGATFASVPGSLIASNPGPGSPMSTTGGGIGTDVIVYGVLNGAGPRYSAVNCQYTMVTFITNGWPSQIQSSGDWNGCCTSNARNYPACSPCDDDCDGVGNACDICPGADDSVDANNDGIADCSQSLDYDNYSADWKCAANKIQVCHNSHTNCISKNALQAHINHGDYVGPCVSCAEETGTSSKSTRDISLDLDINIFPNPTSGAFSISLDGLQTGIVGISIYNQVGSEVWNNEIDVYSQSSIDFNLSSANQIQSGIYIVAIRHNEQVYTKRLVIRKF